MLSMLRIVKLSCAIVISFKIYSLVNVNDVVSVLDEYLWYNSAFAEIEDYDKDDMMQNVDSMLGQENENSLALDGSNVNAVRKDDGVLECTSAEKKLFVHLFERHNKLRDIESMLSEKSHMLEAVQEAIHEELSKLSFLKNEVDVVLKEYKKEEDKHILGLARIYENMKAQEASRIFNDISLSVSLEVMNRMDKEKLAAILSKMDTNRARELTIELANYNRLEKLS